MFAAPKQSIVLLPLAIGMEHYRLCKLVYIGMKSKTMLMV